MANPKIQVVQGDITRIKSDALVTAINSGGMWFGGIDGAIQRVAGDLYHKQAASAMPLKNLQTVVARGGARPDRKIGFRDVIFVVDDLESSLQEVVYTGLLATNNQSYKIITIPTIRMGVMLGAVEKTPEEAVARMAEGVHRFLNDYKEKTSLEDLSFVVYNDAPLAKKLSQSLR
jgi:O-acetyl-ADP-ribose deacetylase (regulator of RNase III)